MTAATAGELKLVERLIRSGADMLRVDQVGVCRLPQPFSA